MPLAGRWATAGRVVGIRLDGMDGVLMTTPALRALAMVRPPVELALLTSPAAAEVALLIPEVAEVLVQDPDAEPEVALADGLRRGRFDGAVLFDTDPALAVRAGRVCRLAGVPLQVGHAAERRPAIAHDTPPRVHEVRRALDLVASIGGSIEDDHESVRVPPAAARWVRTRLAEAGVGRDRPWAALHVGHASGSTPLDRLVEAVGSLAVDHGWRIVVVAPDDGITARRIARGPDAAAVVSLAGELDLPHVAALLACAPVVIAANLGAAHLAAAVATPVVAIQPHDSGDRTPWRVPSRVLDQHAHPTQLVAATLELAAGVSGLVRGARTAVGAAAR